MIETIVKIALCHLIGDYVLQTDFIASTKAKNVYHMFVHCALYCAPFAYAFGINYRLAIVFVGHFIIDALKAHGVIGYVYDQFSHYVIVLPYILQYLFNGGGT